MSGYHVPAFSRPRGRSEQQTSQGQPDAAVSVHGGVTSGVIEARMSARAGPGRASPARRNMAEVLVFVVASAMVALGAGVVGMMLTSPATSKEIPADLLSGTCLDEPFHTSNGVVVGSLARLCFEIESVRPRVELTGVTNGALYTGWLARGAPPRSVQGSLCEMSDPGVAATLQPERFDATIADRTGRAQLSANLPGLKLPSGSIIRLLVVDHGWAGPNQTALRAEQLPLWNGAWVQGMSTVASGDRAPGHLVGCASFWLRGGVETLED
jgi:hypothetical protein